MKLPPNAEKITLDDPNQINVDQDFLLLEMAKILEQKDDIIEKKYEVIAQLKNASALKADQKISTALALRITWTKSVQVMLR